MRQRRMAMATRGDVSLSIDRAREIARARAFRKPAERVAIDSALGRVLAEDHYAPWNIPGEDRSRMDGYAVHSVDVADASEDSPVRLKLREEILAAGHAAGNSLQGGEAVRILTGAPMPRGADAVIPDELCRIAAGELIATIPTTGGEWVNGAGTESRAGDLVLPEGTFLSAGALTLLAAYGWATIPVYQQVQVALLGTGDELLEFGQTEKAPGTYCNTRYLLQWLVRERGGMVIVLGNTGDCRSQIAKRLDACRTDLVISTGGTGYGERDFILDAWRETGIEVVFRQLGLSPGKSTALGARANTLYWALPGAPWACMAIFLELIAPLMDRMQGRKDCGVRTVAAELVGTVSNPRKVTRVVYGNLDLSSSPATFSTTRSGKHSMFKNIADQNAYILAPPGTEALRSGQTLDVRPCGGFY